MAGCKISTLEVDIEIKADPKAFHEVYSCRPHHVSNVSPSIVQAVDLHEGQWGKSGKIINWSYVEDGKAMTAKEIVESIDYEKNTTRFKVIGGDLMEEYKSFVLELQVTPKNDGAGSVVHWTVEYELKHDQVRHPHTVIDLLVGCAKDIDAHLVATET